MKQTVTRIEFGVERGEGCSCRTCRRNCMYLPGFLIPADLERMIPEGEDPLKWAEVNLEASPGANVKKDGETFRIPTLVMASKEDGSCIYFEKRKCLIWETSPFGCAFFDCRSKDDPEQDRIQHQLSQHGLKAVFDAWRTDSLYKRVWYHLMESGHESEPPEDKRARMLES
jgi:hypothetical protein